MARTVFVALSLVASVRGFPRNFSYYTEETLKERTPVAEGVAPDFSDKPWTSSEVSDAAGLKELAIKLCARACPCTLARALPRALPRSHSRARVSRVADAPVGVTHPVPVVNARLAAPALQVLLT